MNVYSVRLIPKLKIKFCEFFGIATEMAIHQLQQRVGNLETKMDRMDRALRKPVRKNMENRSVEKVSAPAPRKTSAKKAVVKAAPALREVAITAPQETVAPNVSTGPQVWLIQPDAELRQAAQEYFASAAQIVEMDSVPHAEQAPAVEVSAVCFDRALLGDQAARDQLMALAQIYSKAKFIGLSSYLTLAFAESLPQTDSFATWLTRPLKPESFDLVFAPEAARAIS